MNLWSHFSRNEVKQSLPQQFTMFNNFLKIFCIQAVISIVNFLNYVAFDLFAQYIYPPKLNNVSESIFQKKISQMLEFAVLVFRNCLENHLTLYPK